jgi:hypothetical protein
VVAPIVLCHYGEQLVIVGHPKVSTPAFFTHIQFTHRAQ